MAEKSRRLYCVLMEVPGGGIQTVACYACYPTREWAERGMAQADTIWPDRAKYIQSPVDGELSPDEMARATGTIKQEKLI